MLSSVLNSPTRMLDGTNIWLAEKRDHSPTADAPVPTILTFVDKKNGNFSPS